MQKLVYGVGINDADYTVQKKKNVLSEDGTRKQKVIWSCPFYVKWKGMLERGYCPKLEARRPSYVGVSVIKDWHTFSNFRSWMESQQWEGLELDKDILISGNKLYSPETCAFIPSWVNTLLTNNQRKGNSPLGVALTSRGKYLAQVSDVVTHFLLKLGQYDTPEEAHKAWQEGKIQQIYKAVEMYQNETSYREDVEKSLLARVKLLENQVTNKEETTFL